MSAPAGDNNKMAEEAIYELCRSRISVSAQLAKEPGSAPGDICKRLYGHHAHEVLENHKSQPSEAIDISKDVAEQCGNWGSTRPSHLFLTIFNDVLKTLEVNNPLGGVCSPSLLGSNGVCPLTVIATIPDVCRHMSNLIVRAQQEVYLATNYWAKGESSVLISNAFRELSKRASAENRQVVAKIIYDRGNAKQVIDNHQKVPPETYADPDGPIGLPAPEDIPNVNIEIVNYHKPALGTFHAKFMIIDRRIAIVQSNNIMDNDNMEMMAQYEGDIVDSIYDTAMVTWHNALNPPMPCLNSPATATSTPTAAIQSFQLLFDQEGNNSSFTNSNTQHIPNGEDNLERMADHASGLDLPQHTSMDPHYDVDVASEVLRAVATLNPRNGETRIQGVSRLLNGPRIDDQAPSAPEIEPSQTMTPMIPIRPHEPVPMAMVNRPPHGGITNKSVNVPQNAAFMSALRNATKSVFIQTPDLNAEALLPEIVAAARRGCHVTYYYCLGYNDAGELLPNQGGHNEGIANKLFTELEPEFHNNLDIFAYVGKDQIHPIHNKHKKRSCHIKLMIVDGHIGIQGSGNQDTQSWYHSQEVNVMLDSKLICAKWAEGIKQNQNTHLYGKVQKTGEYAGCWLDPETGKMADGSIGVDAGKFAWAKGFVGAVNRVRGVGGF
ncbi:hypothetical protein R6Q59_010175 [Mikania micrantha]